jgi:hypothetical protein
VPAPAKGLLAAPWYIGGYHVWRDHMQDRKKSDKLILLSRVHSEDNDYNPFMRPNQILNVPSLNNVTMAIKFQHEERTFKE